ncbi:hypothetical protein HDU97_007479 [Phlyctochytrium planicorne]|nr:hypothetical protein HDU97_007479 [Phlyctochytrium planicorne]
MESDEQSGSNSSVLLAVAIAFPIVLIALVLGAYLCFVIHHHKPLNQTCKPPMQQASSWGHSAPRFKPPPCTIVDIYPPDLETLVAGSLPHKGDYYRGYHIARADTKMDMRKDDFVIKDYIEFKRDAVFLDSDADEITLSRRISDDFIVCEGGRNSPTTITFFQ